MCWCCWEVLEKAACAVTAIGGDVLIVESGMSLTCSSTGLKGHRDGELEDR